MEKRSDFALVPKGLLGKVKKKMSTGDHDWMMGNAKDDVMIVWLISTASGWEKPQTVTQKLPTKLDGSWTD